MLQNIISVFPIILTVYLAIKTKDVIIALYSGIAAGIISISGGHLIQAIYSFFGDYLLIQFTDPYNVGVIILLSFIAGFIALIEYTDGASAFAKQITTFLDTKIKTQLAAFAFGILIFFSDLGTPLIVGPVFSPLFDKMKICREKLAYIIDSSASPIAILVPFTGWGVYILSLIETQVNTQHLDLNSIDVFLKAIGFQFYSIFTVVLVPIVIITNLDIKAMKKAQNKCEQSTEYKQVNNSSSYLTILIPLLILFFVLISGMINAGFPKTLPGGSEFRIILSTSYFLASIGLIILAVILKQSNLKKLYKVYISGISKASNLTIILLGAWCLSAVIDNLGTADLITTLLQSHVAPSLYPVLIFIVGAILSASTGSSWGTFAILTPFAFSIATISSIDPSLLMGAVLSGGLFGDHISPISDTTILSSTGSNVQLLDHVKTQIPYGIINAISAVICYLGAAIYPSYIWLIIGISISISILFIIKTQEKELL